MLFFSRDKQCARRQMPTLSVSPKHPKIPGTFPVLAQDRVTVDKVDDIRHHTSMRRSVLNGSQCCVMSYTTERKALPTLLIEVRIAD